MTNQVHDALEQRIESWKNEVREKADTSIERCEQIAGEAIKVALEACCPWTLIHALNVAACAKYRSVIASGGDADLQSKWAFRCENTAQHEAKMDELAERLVGRDHGG